MQDSRRPRRILYVYMQCIYTQGMWYMQSDIRIRRLDLHGINQEKSHRVAGLKLACHRLRRPGAADCGAGAVGLHIHIQCKGYAEKICILPSGRSRYPLRRDRQNDPGIRQRLSGGGGCRGRNPPLHAHLFRPGPSAEFRHEPGLWRGIRGAGRRPAQGNRRGLCGI